MNGATWSPANNLQAAALSEATAWKDAMRLCADRMRSSGPHQQTDARLFMLALRLFLRASELALDAVRGHGQAEKIVADARSRFDAACPDAKRACDVIEHFREYAAGTGNLQTGGRHMPQRPDLSGPFWPLGYEPSTDVITLGPYRIGVSLAADPAKLLMMDLWRAVRCFEDAGPCP